MACISSVGLLSHGHGQQARFSSDLVTRSRVKSLRFSNQDAQLTRLTNRPHRKPHNPTPRQILAQSSLSSPYLPSEILTMPFIDRLKLAFSLLFPKSPLAARSPAQIARQRLKMVLFSDRCSVSNLAKQRILENVVKTLSEFVEIEARDRVELSVSTDEDIGTVYSVTVPVRRVRPAYQEADENYEGQIVGVEYKDTGGKSGNVDVTFDFYTPSEN